MDPFHVFASFVFYISNRGPGLFRCLEDADHDASAGDD